MLDPSAPGGRLRAARKAAGLSQTAFAARIGIDPQTLSRYELGKMRVPAEVLDRAQAGGSDGEAGLADASRPMSDVSAGEGPRGDGREDLPGYWLGVIDASVQLLAMASDLIVRGNGLVQEAHGRLSRMSAAGPRWEAASQRAELERERAARRAAGIRPLTEAPDVDRLPETAEELAALAEEALAARRRRRTAR